MSKLKHAFGSFMDWAWEYDQTIMRVIAYFVGGLSIVLACLGASVGLIISLSAFGLTIAIQPQNRLSQPLDPVSRRGPPSGIFLYLVSVCS